MAQEQNLSRHAHLLWLTLFLLVGTFLRLYGLNHQSPPGLEHDEVAHWLINQDILAGEHAIYFTEAYGHEAGYHYVQTGFMLLLGDNALALRLPSVFAGLLLIALTYKLTALLFSRRQALVAAGLTAVLFWPIFYSRLALRAISLPLLSGLSAYFWWRGWGTGQKKEQVNSSPINQQKLRFFILAGLLAGLSFHTYMASRAVPVFYILFAIYLLLFHREQLQQKWLGVGLFFLVYLLVASPLAFYLATNPGIETRIGEVDAPLRALREGDLGPVLENSWRILGMFGGQGDPLWRQNLAYLPVFEPVTAVLFYLGLLFCLIHWRKPRYLYPLLWLCVAAIPSIVTIDAPSSIRIINVLPFLPIFPVLGLKVIHTLEDLSPIFAKLSTHLPSKLLLWALIALFVWNVSRTAHALFVVWPEADEVQFVWQAALTDAAEYLDGNPAAQSVAIAGWTPETMDPPTLALTLVRQDLSLRYFQPEETAVVPQGESSYILRPTILPFQPELEEQLRRWGAEIQQQDTFVVYRFPDQPEATPEFPAEVVFADQVSFLGHKIVSEGQLLTYWRAERPSVTPLRIFLHLVDSTGQLLAQADGLSAPARYWQTGDLIIQHHALYLPDGQPAPLTTGQLQLGLYNPQTDQRLFTPTGQEFIILDVPRD